MEGLSLQRWRGSWLGDTLRKGLMWRDIVLFYGIDMCIGLFRRAYIDVGIFGQAYIGIGLFRQTST